MDRENLNIPLEMVRGDTFSFTLEISDLNLAEVGGIYFTAKRRQNDPDSEAVFQKSLGDGIEYDDDEDSYRVRVAPEDTEGARPGVYFYDVQLNVEDDVYTLFAGKLTMLPDTTKRRR